VVGAATAKLYENQSMYGHVGQPTNYSLMNEAYVLFQYRVKIGRLSSRDSFVSDAGDLKLDARRLRPVAAIFISLITLQRYKQVTIHRYHNVGGLYLGFAMRDCI